jgi:Ulp1 family protease
LKDEAKKYAALLGTVDTFNEAEWNLIQGSILDPQQNNGFDCGVFAAMNADFISDNLPLLFSQDDMSNFRIKIGSAILRGSLGYALP